MGYSRCATCKYFSRSTEKKLLVFALKEVPKNGSQMEGLVWNTKRKNKNR